MIGEGSRASRVIRDSCLSDTVQRLFDGDKSLLDWDAPEPPCRSSCANKDANETNVCKVSFSVAWSSMLFDNGGEGMSAGGLFPMVSEGVGETGCGNVPIWVAMLSCAVAPPELEDEVVESNGSVCCNWLFLLTSVTSDRWMRSTSEFSTVVSDTISIDATTGNSVSFSFRSVRSGSSAYSPATCGARKDTPSFAWYCSTCTRNLDASRTSGRRTAAWTRFWYRRWVGSCKSTTQEKRRARVMLMASTSRVFG